MGFPPNWTREEAILALDLYHRVGLVGERHPEVQAVSRTLKELTPLPEQVDPAMFRNPPGVAMKLANFARLDPKATAGLEAGSRVDEEVWNEYVDNPQELARAAGSASFLLARLRRVPRGHPLWSRGAHESSGPSRRADQHKLPPGLAAPSMAKGALTTGRVAANPRWIESRHPPRFGTYNPPIGAEVGPRCPSRAREPA
jgi:hypothetical protein